jgi:hypothetical protein
MAETLTKVVYDCATGETQTIPLTAEEIAQYEIDKIESEQRRATIQAEIEAKAEAKASALAKLTALGLTEDEAKAIVG